LQILSVACSTEIVKNNLIGSLRLNDFNATMKWSKIGEFQTNYVQVSQVNYLEFKIYLD